MTGQIATEKLTPTVGAQVLGVDVDRMLHDDELPAWTLAALEDNGVLVFRDLHIDDAAQVAFSQRLGRVEVLGTGEHPEIFLVTLDPARSRAAAYLRGTFDWHIDGLTDDIPIMATVLSAHGVAASAARPSSPAPTPPMRAWATRNRRASPRSGWCTASRRPSGG